MFPRGRKLMPDDGFLKADIQLMNVIALCERNTELAGLIREGNPADPIGHIVVEYLHKQRKKSDMLLLHKIRSAVQIPFESMKRRRKCQTSGSPVTVPGMRRPSF